VRTGKSGQDASDWIPGGLLPDIYLSPYVQYAPDLVFVVDQNGMPCGYAIAAADTAAFVAWYREHWLPVFLERHRVVDQSASAADRLAQTGRHPENFLGPDQDRYPAHMHIDLLPVAQGQGVGRRLMQAMLAELHRRGIPGVQLGVGAGNSRARGFYAHLGFRPLPSAPGNPLQLCISTDHIGTTVNTGTIPVGTGREQ
jgi:GNAT superfamily N-acetyltransferase